MIHVMCTHMYTCVCVYIMYTCTAGKSIIHVVDYNVATTIYRHDALWEFNCVCVECTPDTWTLLLIINSILKLNRWYAWYP